eukprot:7290022-Lingulodinium_polyedra.AAC.1
MARRPHQRAHAGQGASAVQQRFGGVEIHPEELEVRLAQVFPCGPGAGPSAQLHEVCQRHAPSMQLRGSAPTEA